MAKLKGLNITGACQDGADYFNSFDTPQDFVKNCYRGDWLLWLFKRTNPEDIRLLTLAKAHCANTVRHLMKDNRSIAAVDAAIAFGNGKITVEELKADGADAATYDAADAAYAAAAYAADADAAAAYDAAVNARTKNRQDTADSCRKYLPLEVWNF